MEKTVTISVPEAGERYFGLGRNAAYAAAERGDIPTIRIGKLLRVPVVAMDKIVGDKAPLEPEVTHGGVRPGAGRPKGTKKDGGKKSNFNTRISQDLRDGIETVGSALDLNVSQSAELLLDYAVKMFGREPSKIQQFIISLKEAEIEEIKARFQEQGSQ